MTDKGKRKVSEVIGNAKEKIRNQLESAAKTGNDTRNKVKKKTGEMFDKASETTKDTKSIVKENAESIATFLSVMLVL